MNTSDTAPLTTAEFNTIVELVVLWKCIAEDGQVTKEEVGLLGAWLEQRKDVRIGELKNVRNLFRDIVSDQRVTLDEIAKLKTLIESIGDSLEHRPVLEELPDLADETGGDVDSASKKLSRRKTTSFAAISLQEGSIRLGEVTWNWKELFKQISTPLNANEDPGDCYKCSGLGLIILATNRERCWQCGGTGNYDQNQSRSTPEEFLDRDAMS